MGHECGSAQCGGYWTDDEWLSFGGGEVSEHLREASSFVDEL